MFALFFIVLAAAATLSVVGTRSTASDAVSHSLQHAGRHLGSVEMARQSHSILPVR